MLRIDARVYVLFGVEDQTRRRKLASPIDSTTGHENVYKLFIFWSLLTSCLTLPLKLAVALSSPLPRTSTHPLSKSEQDTLPASELQSQRAVSEESRLEIPAGVCQCVLIKSHL